MNRSGMMTGILLLSFFLILTGCTGDEKQYDEAVSLMQQGKYEDAASIFDKLGDFSDSKDRLFECEGYIDLENARKKMEAGEYASAQEILRGLSDIPESEALLRECTDYVAYDKAVEQLEQGEFDAAASAFGMLGDFLDSKSKVEECRLSKRYYEALKLVEMKDYATARAAFVLLGNFKDSAEQVQKIDALSEDELWKAALQINTYEAYAPFLENTQGRYYQSALDRSEQLLWNTAVQQNTVEAYQAYLDALPNGKNAANAKKTIETLSEQNGSGAYAEAVAKDTILALQEFMEAYPKSAHLSEASEKIEAMKNDSKYYDALLEDFSQETADRFLIDYPGHKDEETLLDLLEQYTGDLKTLVANGIVTASVKGASMQRSTMSITNLTRFKVTVTLNYGTYFIAKDASKDNMLLTKEYTLQIDPEKNFQQDVQTCSMNLFRKTPSSEDSFEVGSLSAGNKLVRLLPVFSTNQAGYPVIQAAVWMVTDSASDAQLLDSLYYTDNTPVIKQTDIDKAKNILAQVG